MVLLWPQYCPQNNGLQCYIPLRLFYSFLEKVWNGSNIKHFGTFGTERVPMNIEHYNTLYSYRIWSRFFF